MRTTSDLIETLAADAKPIRRLRPPLLRAALWLAGFLALAGIITLASGAWPKMILRLHDVRFAVEMAATLLTGMAAIMAAFYVCLPDRALSWRFLPLPFLALWLASSGYECYRNWIVLGPDRSLGMGESMHCFGFIVGISVPLAAALYFAMRRARPLNPLPVMAVGGLGVAALAATLLQFYHPFDVTVMDLGLHLAAVTVVIAAMSGLGQWKLHPSPGYNSNV